MPSDTLSPTTEAELIQAYKDKIELSLANSIDAGSIQDDAVRLVAVDDTLNLSVDDPDLLERWALYVLYLSTDGFIDGGGGWDQNRAGSFKQDVGVCQWGGSGLTVKCTTGGNLEYLQMSECLS